MKRISDLPTLNILRHVSGNTGNVLGLDWVKYATFVISDDFLHLANIGHTRIPNSIDI